MESEFGSPEWAEPENTAGEPEGTEPETPWDSGYEPDLDSPGVDDGSDFDTDDWSVSELSTADDSPELSDADTGVETASVDAEPVPVSEIAGADPDVLPAEDSEDSDPWSGLPQVDPDDVPEPSDGGPWTDVSVLGTDSGYNAETVDPISDLAESNGDENASWAQLQSAEDPAIRALAQFWGPTALAS